MFKVKEENFRSLVIDVQIPKLEKYLELEAKEFQTQESHKKTMMDFTTKESNNSPKGRVP